MVWIPLGAFNQLYTKNQEKFTHNDLKSFEFGQKGNSSKAGACKDTAEENKISIKESSILEQDHRKDSLRASKEPAELHLSKVQN